MQNDCTHKSNFKFRVDAETKKKAQAIARAEGVPLSKIFNQVIRQIAEKGTTKFKRSLD
jgi:antitoxin component of RelBE/YafQ-DinJ toxin-antitoxin module